MKKKVLAVLLAAAMVFSLAACSSSSSSSEDTSASGDTSSEESSDTAEASTVDGSSFKVGLITDTGGINDESFNQSSWEGLNLAIDDFGITANYLEAASESDYATNLATFVDEDYDLIICVGYMLADACAEAAEANPDIAFAIIDDSTIEMDNVTCLMFEQEQAAYLAGYAAGLTTESDIIGFVLGMSSETMHQFGYGYLAGAIDANPDVTVLQYNANSFADAATGKADAQAAITNGADVVFHAAGGTGLGVIEACSEAGIYAIGVDSDQSSVAPEVVLTSALKRVDTAVYDTVEKLLNGTLEGGVVTYDLSVDGVGIVTPGLLSDDAVTAIESVKEQIADGTIVVPSTQDDFEATYGEVYELD